MAVLVAVAKESSTELVTAAETEAEHSAMRVPERALERALLGHWDFLTMTQR